MAGNSLGKAYVQIVPSAEGIQGSITKVLSPETTAAGIDAGQKMGNAAKGALVGAISVGAVMAAKKLKDFGAECIELYNVQKEAETKLATVMKGRMGASQADIDSIKNYASELQKVGVIGDEVTIAGTQQLATFTQSTSALKKLMPAMQDLAVQQHGVAVTGGDMASIANMMGKAMTGQVGALTRVGITLTDTQKELIKTGNEEQRAAVLAEVIKNNVGDMNAEMAKTDAGKIAQYQNALGDLKEQLGAQLLPVQVKFYEAAYKVIEFLSEKAIPFIEKYKDVIIALAAGITGTIVAFKAYSAIMAIKAAVDLYGAGTLAAYAVAQAAAIAPILAAVAAITLIVYAGIKLYKNWDVVKEKAKQFGDYIGSIFGKIKDKITSIFTAIKNTTVKVWNAVKYAITHPIDTAFKLIKARIDAIKKLFNITLKFAGIKLPHLSFNMKAASGAIEKAVSKLFGLGGNIPTLGVKWYAKGGVFSQPTLAGIGEAGPEAVVPLNAFWDKMDRMMDGIVNGVSLAVAGIQGGGDVTIQTYLYPNGPKMDEYTVKAYDRGKRRLG